MTTFRKGPSLKSQGQYRQDRKAGSLRERIRSHLLDVVAGPEIQTGIVEGAKRVIARASAEVDLSHPNRCRRLRKLNDRIAEATIPARRKVSRVLFVRSGFKVQGNGSRFNWKPTLSAAVEAVES